MPVGHARISVTGYSRPKKGVDGGKRVGPFACHISGGDSRRTTQVAAEDVKAIGTFHIGKFEKVCAMVAGRYWLRPLGLSLSA